MQYAVCIYVELCFVLLCPERGVFQGRTSPITQFKNQNSPALLYGFRTASITPGSAIFYVTLIVFTTALFFPLLQLSS